MIVARNSTHLCNITIDKAEHVWLDSDCLGHPTPENIMQGEHHYKLKMVDWPYLLLRVSWCLQTFIVYYCIIIMYVQNVVTIYFMVLVQSILCGLQSLCII